MADALSRLHLPEVDENLHREIEVYVHQVTQIIPLSDKRLDETKLYIEKDEQLALFNEVIQSGWPNTRKQCDTDLLTYWNFQHELSHQNGIIFKG